MVLAAVSELGWRKLLLLAGISAVVQMLFGSAARRPVACAGAFQHRERVVSTACALRGFPPGELLTPSGCFFSGPWGHRLLPDQHRARLGGSVAGGEPAARARV